MQALCASRPGRLRLLLFIGVGTFAALAFLALIAWAQFRQFLRDEPAPPDDSDLRVTLEAIPVEENGLAQLSSLDGDTLDFSRFAQPRGLDDDEVFALLAGRADNPEVVDAFLAQAAPALAQIEALLALPRFEAAGEFSAARDFTEWQRLGEWRVAATLGATRRWRAGDYAGAAAELKRLQALVRRLTTGQQYLVALGFAGDIHSTALEFTARLMNDPALPTATRAELAVLMAPAPDWFPAAARALRLDYSALAWDVEHFPERIATETRQKEASPTERAFNQHALEFFLPLFFKRNATLRLLGEQFRPLLAALEQPYANSANELRAAHLQLAQPPVGADLANAAGRIYVQVETSGLQHRVEQIFRNVAGDRLLQTGLAVRAYYDAEGKLPTDLPALVPQYLPAVPTDPFDGQPLRYDAARGVVYSVGTSLEDRGGASAAPPPAHHDYSDLLLDAEQPTLVLTFHKRPGARADN